MFSFSHPLHQGSRLNRSQNCWNHLTKLLEEDEAMNEELNDEEERDKLLESGETLLRPSLRSIKIYHVGGLEKAKRVCFSILRIT